MPNDTDISSLFPPDLQQQLFKIVESHDQTAGITRASHIERANHWKDTPESERMVQWKREMNTFLNQYKTDPSKKQQHSFLKRILKPDTNTNLDDVQVNADNIYNTFIEQAHSEVEFFARRIVETNSFAEIEQNKTIIEKLARIFGENSAKIAMLLIHNFVSTNKNSQPATDYLKQAPKDYEKPHSIIGTNLQTNIDIAISQKARLHGLYIIGANGTGKSTLLANLILQDIHHGGVCLIEPHGDLTKTIIAGLPEKRVKDVILLNVEDVDYPFGINLYECQRLTIRDMAQTASFVSHVFEKIWYAGTETPRLMQNLRALTRTLIENPGTTFAEIPLLYSNDTVRTSLLENLSNPSIISYWEDYEAKPQRERSIYLESTLNKVNAFLDEPMIRNIFAQSKTTIDFRTIMDNGKILLVKLSPQFEEASRLIGAVIIGKLLMAAFSRADTPEASRRQFNLYVDEFQRVATSDFATLISEARKFRIATTLSHQTLSQVDEANRTAALAAGCLLVFRVSGEDGKTLAKSFGTTPTQQIIGEEPVRAPISDVISHLVKRGHNNERVTRFAQVYLKKLENLIRRTSQDNYYLIYWGSLYISLTTHDIRLGRELLNTAFYRSMTERSTRFLIPPLALYMLSVAQQDTSEETFYPFIKLGFLAPPYYEFGYHDLKEFKKEAAVFGDPYFINQDYAQKFIHSREKKSLFGNVTRQSKQEMQSARQVVKMITELRYTMTILSQQPILVDTGQYQPKYQNRTFADMENEIARDLTNQPNFQARVKLLTSEHTIQTKNTPACLSGELLTERLSQIQAQTRKNYCKRRTEVEKEIRQRHEKLRGSTAPIEPPPTYYTSEEPPPTHF